jgi:hypothetical protein
MGSKNKGSLTQKQTGSQTMTYGQVPGASSADIGKLRGMVANPNEIDPTVAYNAASRRRDYNNTFNNPLGSYTTPAAREAAERSAGRAMSMEEGVMAQAARGAAQERSFGQQSYLASLTAPTTVQTGGTSTGSMTGNSVGQYNPGIGSYIAQGAGAAAGMI